MRHRLLTVFVAVVLILAAFAFGLLVQRQVQLARIRAAENFARDLAGLNDPIPPSPDFEQWHYPKARVLGSTESPAVSVSGKAAHAGGRYALLLTPDELEAVAGFYTDAMHFADADKVARSRSAISSEGNIQGESRLILDDCRETPAGSTAAFRTKCLAYRSPSYDLTVFLSRASEEPQTRITLLYNPKAAPRPTALE